MFVFTEKNLFGNEPHPIIVRQYQQDNLKAHTHDFLELVFILRGNCEHNVTGEKKNLRSGDFFTIEEKQCHSYSQTNNLFIMNIAIKSTAMDEIRPTLKKLKGYKNLFLENSQSNLTPRRLLPQELSVLTQLAMSIEQEKQLENDGNKTMVYLLLQQLLVIACRYAGSESPFDNQEQIRDAIMFIESNYPTNITVAKLAELSFMSIRSLQRKFVKVMKVTPMKYLAQVRVKNSARLLLETDLKAYAIAYKCGFSDTPYFIRQFKKIMGISPGEYRKQSLR
jgi:AraC family L-rhamnose operon transcriptional activator RhaR/AraC family L-rhamnose operon regulatory protein RhaS